MVAGCKEKQVFLITIPIIFLFVVMNIKLTLLIGFVRPETFGLIFLPQSTLF